jgi:predicted dehydrogenase
MTEPLRLGLVGAGAIARTYVEALQDHPKARLVAVADVRAEAAAQLAGLSGATAYRRHGDMVASGTCDAVLVTTPPATHAPIVLDLLRHRLPVLCEKPLSIDVASAAEMCAAAARAGILMTMASKFRYVDDVIRMREMLASGVIGAPLLLENLFTARVDMTRRWNSDPILSGGGVLIDNGTHSVDIVRYLLGPITEVLAVRGPRLQPIRVEDTATLFGRTRGGVHVTIELSWSLHKDRSAWIGLYGEHGTIEVGWQQSRVRTAPGGAWTTFGSGYDKVRAFRRQLDNFVGAVRGDEPPLLDGADARASVAVIQAAYRSLETGTWTAVGDDDLAAADRPLRAVLQ